MPSVDILLLMQTSMLVCSFSEQCTCIAMTKWYMMGGREASANGPGMIVSGSLFDQSVTVFRSWSNGTLEYVDHICEGERLIGRFPRIFNGVIFLFLAHILALYP
jgi:hypothetical protein